jgi:hypothetical protein
MMFYNPHSYDAMKQQLDERMVEMQQIRCAEQMEGQRPGKLQQVGAKIGSLLIRMGTRLAQPSQPARPIGS